MHKPIRVFLNPGAGVGVAVPGVQKRGEERASERERSGVPLSFLSQLGLMQALAVHRLEKAGLDWVCVAERGLGALAGMGAYLTFFLAQI